ncbi:MAG: shikimate dehydrogenase [Clostridia bacterium]|nr:shikimate dehydrogenase [Clostridia bacterium]
MKYALIGERLGHSLSASIHARLASHPYELIELSPEALPDFLAKRDFIGINVTIPYKETVIPYLDEIDGRAREIGAVNTVINRGGRLIGYNTDLDGLTALILRTGVNPRGKRALVLGTGGTSKTAVTALSSLGAREVIRASRTGREGALTYDEVYASYTDVEIIVNTTPVGMYPKTSGTPISLSRFPRLLAVVDAIYNPLSTPLVLEARERGVAAVGGLYMLVRQAVRASELFTSEKYEDGVTDTVYAELLRERESIALIGMPSAGKSTVGKILAERLGRALIDTDTLIETRTGRAPGEIISDLGESAFRDIEAEAVSELADSAGLVIATGGGVPLRPENLLNLRKNGRIVFLDRPLDELSVGPDRPLSSSKEALERLYNARYGIYSAAADIKITVSGTPDEVADSILSKLNECKLK